MSKFQFVGCNNFVADYISKDAVFVYLKFSNIFSFPCLGKIYSWTEDSLDGEAEYIAREVIQFITHSGLIFTCLHVTAYVNDKLFDYGLQCKWREYEKSGWEHEHKYYIDYNKGEYFL